MRSTDADRLVVEFAKLLNADRVLLVGSQAIHAHYPDPPIDVVVASSEVDVVPLPYERYAQWFFYAHEKLGDLSDFAIENNDMYVDMVKPSVPKLPQKWEQRCIQRQLALGDGRSVCVLYPEIHDLAVTKLLANRPQDAAFLRGLISLGCVDRATLEARLDEVALPIERTDLRDWAMSTISWAFDDASGASGVRPGA